MANWHLDLYGSAKTPEDATKAVKAIVDTAKSNGLDGGYVQSPELKVDLSNTGLPKAAKEPAK